MRDPYETLGVSRQASAEEIKTAFRRLAREHHPDRNPGDSAAQSRFQEINAAHQLLSDPERRARFDQFGGEPSAADPPFRGGPAGLEDLLGELFGAFGKRPTNRGDMRQAVTLTFEQAALGCKTKLNYTRLDVCADCAGSCAAPGSPSLNCTVCNGRGRVGVSAAGWMAVQTERACTACAGRGRIPKQACPSCDGRGLKSQRREVEVAVPAGIESGASQTIAGAGSRVRAGKPAGDLELVIQVEDHPVFRRDGDDVISDLPIPYVVAALGGEVDVATLHGVQKLRIPEGTQNSEQLRLRGQGVPHRFRGGAGDHLVRAKIKIPERLSPRARELVSAFEGAVGAYEDAGILGKIRGFFSGSTE